LTLTPFLVSEEAGIIIINSIMRNSTQPPIQWVPRALSLG